LYRIPNGRKQGESRRSKSFVAIINASRNGTRTAKATHIGKKPNLGRKWGYLYDTTKNKERSKKAALDSAAREGKTPISREYSQTKTSSEKKNTRENRSCAPKEEKESEEGIEKTAPACKEKGRKGQKKKNSQQRRKEKGLKIKLGGERRGCPSKVNEQNKTKVDQSHGKSGTDSQVEGKRIKKKVQRLRGTQRTHGGGWEKLFRDPQAPRRGKPAHRSLSMGSGADSSSKGVSQNTQPTPHQKQRVC